MNTEIPAEFHSEVTNPHPREINKLLQQILDKLYTTPENRAWLVALQQFLKEKGHYPWNKEGTYRACWAWYRFKFSHERKEEKSLSVVIKEELDATDEVYNFFDSYNLDKPDSPFVQLGILSRNKGEKWLKGCSTPKDVLLAAKTLRYKLCESVVIPDFLLTAATSKEQQYWFQADDTKTAIPTAEQLKDLHLDESIGDKKVFLAEPPTENGERFRLKTVSLTQAVEDAEFWVWQRP